MSLLTIGIEKQLVLCVWHFYMDIAFSIHLLLLPHYHLKKYSFHFIYEGNKRKRPYDPGLIVCSSWQLYHKVNRYHFLGFIKFCFRVWVCSLYECLHHVCSLSAEAGRESQILWTWSYSRLWVTVLVLAANLGPLQVQKLLLTAKASLKLHSDFFFLSHLS